MAPGSWRMVPLVDVFGLVVVQAEGLFVYQSSRAAQFVGRLRGVGLEECQYILLEDAYHAQVYGIEVDGSEGDEQALGVGQDGCFRPQFHLWLEVLFAEDEGVRGAEFLPVRVLDALVQVQCQFSIGLLCLVRIGQDFVGFHLEECMGDFLDFHQPFQVLRGVQRG